MSLSFLDPQWTLPGCQRIQEEVQPQRQEFRFEYTAKTGICGEVHLGNSRMSAPPACFCLCGWRPRSSPQLSETDRDVNIFRNQIEEEIRDEEIDPDPRLSFQKPREEIQEALLTQDDRNRHSQHTFGRLLSQGQNSLSWGVRAAAYGISFGRRGQ